MRPNTIRTECAALATALSVLLVISCWGTAIGVEAVSPAPIKEIAPGLLEGYIKGGLARQLEASSPASRRKFDRF